jgi:hypothetical protein
MLVRRLCDVNKTIIYRLSILLIKSVGDERVCIHEITLI